MSIRFTFLVNNDSSLKKQSAAVSEMAWRKDGTKWCHKSIE